MIWKTANDGIDEVDFNFEVAAREIMAAFLMAFVTNEPVMKIVAKNFERKCLETGPRSPDSCLQ
jgi:hypothetical protein